MTRRVWPKEPAGEARNITVNGTIRSEGEQSPFSNGFYPKGNAGTTSTSPPLNRGTPRANRTGEGVY